MLYYIKKAFLAPEQSAADSSISVSIHKPTKVTEYNEVNVDVTVRDCNQGANIGFSFRTEKQFKAAVDKLDVLISHLTELKKQMHKANKDFRKEYIKIVKDEKEDE